MNLLLYSLNGNVPYSIDATVVAYWIGTNKVNVRMYAPMVITSTTGRGTSKMSSFSRFSIGNCHLPIDVERQYNSFINIDPSIFEYGLLGLFIHFLLLNQKCTIISLATISIIFKTTYFIWLITIINYKSLRVLIITFTTFLKYDQGNACTQRTTCSMHGETVYSLSYLCMYDSG